jgi:mRNA-degrading endonuclease RelE of RelBE toxin-antitoxin system
MRIEWSPKARASARRYMDDQDGIRVGPYRVKYVVDDDVITIERVDRVL